MGHLSWQSLSASGALWRLQAAGAASLWTHTPAPPCAPWSCPVWLLLALLSTSLDTQSSLPFNTLCKHIKWKFRRARTPKGGSSLPHPVPSHRDTHAKCRHLHSERIFHVTFAKAKQTFARAIREKNPSKNALFSCCLISLPLHLSPSPTLSFSLSLSVLIATVFSPLLSLPFSILASICFRQKEAQELETVFSFFSSVL